MAYGNGFHYVNGPVRRILSAVSSTATFVEGCPVKLGGSRTVSEWVSDDTFIYGISCHKAADSIYAGYCLIEIPTPDTIYAAKAGTGGTASEMSAGQSVAIEKSGNYFIINEDSQASVMVTLVPRDMFTTIDSADSSVFFHFLSDALGVFYSRTSSQFSTA